MGEDHRDFVNTGLHAAVFPAPKWVCLGCGYRMYVPTTASFPVCPECQGAWWSTGPKEQYLTEGDQS